MPVMTLGLRKVRGTLNDKSTWIRIPERETVKSPCPVYKDGDWIETKRTIVRTGYWLTHTDMPADLFRERMLHHLVNRGNWHFEHAGQRVSGPGTHETDYVEERAIEGPITKEIVEAIMAASWHSEKAFFNRVGWSVRRRWLHQVKAGKFPELQTDNPLSLKTFYYLEHENPVSYQVRDIVMRQCGHWNGARPSGTYGDEYEPPYLAATVYQQLYHVGSQSFMSRKKSDMLYVHPEDVI